MNPQEGGKYQYSLSLLDGLASLDKSKYNVFAYYNNKDWELEIPKSFTSKIHVPKNVISRFIRKVTLALPFGLKFWRLVSTYLDPLCAALNHIQPDLVFFPGNDSLAYELKLPSVIPVFDLMHLYETSFLEIGDAKQVKHRNRHYTLVSKYANAFLTDSELGSKHLMDNFKANPNNIFVLPYIAPDYIKSINIEIDVVSRFNIPKNFIFYPAQFWSHKNHKNLILALSILKEKGSLVNAVLVGSKKNAYKEIESLIKKHELTDQIFILDYVSNKVIVSLYKQAQALVMPTFCGPTNIPQLEAFALGCPVITSNVYAIPQQVGDAALLSDPNNPEDIANQIKLIWTDENLRQKLISKGCIMDKQNSKIKYQERLNRIIESILKRQ